MKKVIAYIDGFNLYYRALKQTKWKWLDLEALVKNLMPNHEILKIRYFTAIVKNKEHELRQNAYLKALESRLNSKIEIHKGLFKEKGKTYIEKQSDVSLGTYIIYDAFKLNYDCVLLISNDSDFYEPIKIVKTQLNKIVIVANPDRKKGFSYNFLELKDSFGISLKKIRMKALEKSQLPNPVILSNGKEIKKPNSW